MSRGEIVKDGRRAELRELRAQDLFDLFLRDSNGRKTAETFPCR
jgi:hypothetical protein